MKCDNIQQKDAGYTIAGYKFLFLRFHLRLRLRTDPPYLPKLNPPDLPQVGAVIDVIDVMMTCLIRVQYQTLVLEMSDMITQDLGASLG